ncbi:ATP-binding cassette domain-containing protein [Sinorhizobium meliloti]|uniref:ATP-binding cassette domain-containing protein n=1 Tax=Rhizobium meliloti TaxID=382 RepID=UPI001F29260C|nr:ATP-binding cassette domain-containing protein [Sinorhizobium meliloti]
MAGLVVAARGSNSAIVRNVSFKLAAGQGVGIICPSGSGKSTLARALVGVWPPARGMIRLDGAELSHWEPEALGSSIGYLPQGVELFDGTIAENISRFASNADPAAIIEAAGRRASVDPVDVGRLRHADRCCRRHPVGWLAPAHRPCPGALRQAVPAGARRAECQPQCRRRGGACPPGRAGRSSSSSPTGRTP